MCIRHVLQEKFTHFALLNTKISKLGGTFERERFALDHLVYLPWCGVLVGQSAGNAWLATYFSNKQANQAAPLKGRDSRTCTDTGYSKGSRTRYFGTACIAVAMMLQVFGLITSSFNCCWAGFNVGMHVATRLKPVKLIIDLRLNSLDPCA